MNNLSEIKDEEFIPFLNSLGVDTYKKSFEWMFNDPNFSNILLWIFNSLDENNALSAREEYRYAEIEKQGNVTSQQDLDQNIVTLQQKYPGINLPGEKASEEDVVFDIKVQKERLAMLEEHEEALRDLLKQNELINEELNVDVTNLKAAIQQHTEDETAAKDECANLAQELGKITNDVIIETADVLNIYENTKTDQDIAKKLFAFGPMDAYQQYQSMFLTSYQEVVCQLNTKAHHEHISQNDLQNAYFKAEQLKERVLESVEAYIDTKATLSGEQGKLALIKNFKNYHPSQVYAAMLETQHLLELAVRENKHVEDEVMFGAVKRYVARRTELALDVSARNALMIREDMMTSLNLVADTLREATALDQVLYTALRTELAELLKVLHFANQIQTYLERSEADLQARMKSMGDICLEVNAAEHRPHSSDRVLSVLTHILTGATANSDAVTAIKSYSELQNGTRDILYAMAETRKSKEHMLVDMRQLSECLKQYVYNGCTRRPNCHNRGAASGEHALRQSLHKTDARVVQTSGLFNTVKNGDQHNLRKLWQWFLTDQARLLAAIKY